MLARPRRWIRAGLPRLSRSWMFGTVMRRASQAVFAPDAAMRSDVIRVGWPEAKSSRVPPFTVPAQPCTSSTAKSGRQLNSRARQGHAGIGALPLKLGREGRLVKVEEIGVACPQRMLRSRLGNTEGRGRSLLRRLGTQPAGRYVTPV